MSNTPQDSYQKFATSFWGTDDVSDYIVFEHVHPEDIDEVKVQFALMVHDLDYADNFRIEPLSRTKEFFEKKKKGCCGSADSQVVCKSKRIYWIGCNYGH